MCIGRKVVVAVAATSTSKFTAKITVSIAPHVIQHHTKDTGMKMFLYQFSSDSIATIVQIRHSSVHLLGGGRRRQIKRAGRYNHVTTRTPTGTTHTTFCGRGVPPRVDRRLRTVAVAVAITTTLALARKRHEGETQLVFVDQTGTHRVVRTNGVGVVVGLQFVQFRGFGRTDAGETSWMSTFGCQFTLW